MTTREARSQGRIRGSGVSIVPSRSRSVATAAAVRLIQASTPQTASQTNSPSQPAASAATARRATAAASPKGSTIPKRMLERP